MLSRAFSSWGRLLGLSPNDSTLEEDRRLWGRLPCDVKTTCQLASDHTSERLDASVRNVSCGGIHLELARSFEPGSLLSVSLPACGVDAEVLACVVRCMAGETGSWELGCTFASQLSDEDLQSFGARRERSAAPDQRAWVRYECHGRATYQVVRAAVSSASGPATVVNISASGIALQLEEPLHVGELLSLELSRDGVTVLTTLASVVRAGAGPNASRLIGCNFIRELTEEQVLMLL
jgi:hypothetical protein